jgi:hypothetical protein
MLWIYLAEAVLIVSILIGFVSLFVMAAVGEDGGYAHVWTMLWRVVLWVVAPLYFICLFQIQTAKTSWATPKLALQVLNILALLCAFACVAWLTFLRDRSRSWLAKKPLLARLAVSIVICLWADAIASAIPFMVRSSAHDLGLADFTIPDTLRTDAVKHAARKIAAEKRRHELCAMAVAQIPPGHVALPLIDVSTSHATASGQYAIVIPPATNPRASRFEFSYITSRPTRETGPITHYNVLFYGEGRKDWCSIAESGTDRWLGRPSVDSAELRELFSWAAEKAAQDAQYWQERRPRPLEWAAIGVLQEVGYDKFKIEPNNTRAKVLDGILFWVKKLLQAAIVGLLVKGFADAVRPRSAF